MKKVLLVGAGLFNLVLAKLFQSASYYVEIREKENYIGGLCSDYYDYKARTHVSKFGAHILHFDKKTEEALNFIKKYTDLTKYTHKVLCVGNNSISYFPVNNTYKNLYAIFKPYDLIEGEFIKAYSEKMWGKHWPELANYISTSRAKVKNSIDNSFFENEKVFMPSNGYARLMNNLASGIKIKLNQEESIFTINEEKTKWDYIFISTPIDKFYNYTFGKLDWRGLRFEFYIIESKNDILPTSVVNFPTHPEIIRVVEHNQLYNSKSRNKVISVEYICDETKHYPVLTADNIKLYNQYVNHCTFNYSNVIFTGRQGRYKYYDMDDTIMEAIRLFKTSC